MNIFIVMTFRREPETTQSAVTRIDKYALGQTDRLQEDLGDLAIVFFLADLVFSVMRWSQESASLSNEHKTAVTMTKIAQAPPDRLPEVRLRT